MGKPRMIRLEDGTEVPKVYPTRYKHDVTDGAVVTEVLAVRHAGAARAYADSVMDSEGPGRFPLTVTVVKRNRVTVKTFTFKVNTYYEIARVD